MRHYNEHECPMCKHLNDFEDRTVIMGSLIEAFTCCQRCGHKDYWFVGTYNYAKKKKKLPPKRRTIKKGG